MHEVGAVAAEPALGDARAAMSAAMRGLRRAARHRPPCGRGAAAAAARGWPCPPPSGARPRRAPRARAAATRASVSAGAGGGSRKARERGIGHAPGGAVEQEAGEIGRQDLRLGEGFERAGAGLLPEPVADARLGAAGAAAALVGRGARDAHGLQPRQADAPARSAARGRGRCRSRRARPRWSARSRRWRWPAPPCGGRARRARPRGPARAGPSRRRAARDRRRDRATRSRSCVSTRRISPWPGRKTRMEPGSARKRAQHGVGHLVLDAPARIAAEIARLDRKGAALARDDRGVAQQRGDARAVERRGHDEDAQVLAQRRPARRARARGRDRRRASARGTRRTARPRRRSSSGSSRIMRANTPSVTTSIRVLRADLRAEPHAQSHRLADRFAQRARHPVRRRARGEPARLEHDDLAPGDPGLVEQRERHARGLAGARRRDEHGGVASRARQPVRPGEDLVDRQGFVEGAHAAGWPMQAAKASSGGKARGHPAGT